MWTPVRNGSRPSGGEGGARPFPAATGQQADDRLAPYSGGGQEGSPRLVLRCEVGIAIAIHCWNSHGPTEALWAGLRTCAGRAPGNTAPDRRIPGSRELSSRLRSTR